jgi:hypothetical protein
MTWFCPGNPSWFCPANLIPIPIWTECCAINGQPNWHGRHVTSLHSLSVSPRTAHPSTIGPCTLAHSTYPPLPQTQKAQCDHGNPLNDHAIVRNSPHRRAMAFKPFSISPPRRYASTDASTAPVPLPFPRPAPTTVTDARIHDFDLSWPHPIRGEAISPLIPTKPLPLAFE